MIFIIHHQSKSAMQSGKKNTKNWLMTPKEQFNHRSISSDMGWISSNNTSSQLKFTFKTKEDAIAYANKMNYQFEIIDSHSSSIKPKSYANNFL
ncbi:MAG: hypothetical protein RL769_842 [Pseudomonadota bacterium]|jgi:hypothetical protein|nr:ETC complex I subunit region [Alphaproteobacteria bacterium]